MTRLVDADGYRVAADVEKGEDPPIVFLAGIGEPRTVWQRTIELLDCPNTTVSYDRAGVGQSDSRPANHTPLTYSALAMELSRLLDMLAITAPVVIVAHSLGTLIARSFAARHYDRIAGLVLIDGAVDDVILWPGSQPPQDGTAPGATLLDYPAGAAELATATYQPLPAIVLTRTPGRWTSPQATSQVDARWSDHQRAVAAQLGATLIIANDAGHRIQDDAPSLVNLAINAVSATARTGVTSLQLDPGHVAHCGGRIASSGGHPS